MKIKACLTSNNQSWKTPKDIYVSFMKSGFSDPCPENPQFDGLKIDWEKRNFVNPPYNEISLWIDKGLRERERGNMSVFLIPARTDTKWFRKLFEANCHFSLIQGRLKFSESKSAPFPSMFVIMDKNFEYVKFTLLTKESMRELFEGAQYE